MTSITIRGKPPLSRFKIFFVRYEWMEVSRSQMRKIRINLKQRIYHVENASSGLFSLFALPRIGFGPRYYYFKKK